LLRAWVQEPLSDSCTRILYRMRKGRMRGAWRTGPGTGHGFVHCMEGRLLAWCLLAARYPGCQGPGAAAMWCVYFRTVPERPEQWWRGWPFCLPLTGN